MTFDRAFTLAGILGVAFALIWASWEWHLASRGITGRKPASNEEPR
ncbi:MAG: hypothetical protein KGR26_11815 [Cyanobacteria bacterium REEB65]|nr:hypothetical protein [Cyanobacteria bacterium REEB65]